VSHVRDVQFGDVRRMAFSEKRFKGGKTWEGLGFGLVGGRGEEMKRE